MGPAAACASPAAGGLCAVLAWLCAEALTALWGSGGSRPVCVSRVRTMISRAVGSE